jgi:hypothetical protein
MLVTADAGHGRCWSRQMLVTADAGHGTLRSHIARKKSLANITQMSNASHHRAVTVAVNV